jgi:hypothetical protein
MTNPPKNVQVKKFLVSEGISGVFRCKIRHFRASEEKREMFFELAIN